MELNAPPPNVQHWPAHVARSQPVIGDLSLGRALSSVSWLVLELRGEEGKRGMPAVQMLETGNYLVPHLDARMVHRQATPGQLARSGVGFQAPETRFRFCWSRWRL